MKICLKYLTKPRLGSYRDSLRTDLQFRLLQARNLNEKAKVTKSDVYEPDKIDYFLKGNKNPVCLRLVFLFFLGQGMFLL